MEAKRKMTRVYSKQDMERKSKQQSGSDQSIEARVQATLA